VAQRVGVEYVRGLYRIAAKRNSSLECKAIQESGILSGGIRNGMPLILLFFAVAVLAISSVIINSIH